MAQRTHGAVFPRTRYQRAAVNERLYRERRRRGAIVIQRLVLSPAALDGLISLGWLRAADRGDRERVADAFVGFAKRPKSSYPSWRAPNPTRGVIAKVHLGLILA